MSNFVLLSSGPDWAEYWRPLVKLTEDEEVQMRVHNVEGAWEIIIYVTTKGGTQELYREPFTEEEAQAVISAYGIAP